jgi:hypothetical protein
VSRLTNLRELDLIFPTQQMPLGRLIFENPQLDLQFPCAHGLLDLQSTFARKVFAFRGSIAPGVGGVSIEQAWRVEHLKAGTRYKIDEKHLAVSAVLENAGLLLPLVKAMLRVIEETVPIQRIWLDTVENKDTPRTGFSGEPSEAVVEVLNALYTDMVCRKGFSSENAKKSLLSTEPFQNYPILIANLGLSPA